MSLRPTSPSRGWTFLILGGFLCALSGCASSVAGSISDSISSPFESSSDSSDSSSDEREEAYRNDIRDYTYAYVRSNGDAAGLRDGVASIAGRHGVTNWEAETGSYVGIGAGLAKAKVSSSQAVLYASVLADGEGSRNAIERGYRSVQ